MWMYSLKGEIPDRLNGWSWTRSAWSVHWIADEAVIMSCPSQLFLLAVKSFFFQNLFKLNFLFHSHAKHDHLNNSRVLWEPPCWQVFQSFQLFEYSVECVGESWSGLRIRVGGGLSWTIRMITTALWLIIAAITHSHIQFALNCIQLQFYSIAFFIEVVLSSRKISKSYTPKKAV